MFLKFFSVTKMERVATLSNEEASSSEIDENKFLEYSGNVPIWDFGGITKDNFQQFSKQENSNLFLRYYNTVKQRLMVSLVFYF